MYLVADPLRPKVKHVLSGCWTSPGLSLVLFCEIYEKDLKAQLWVRRVSGLGTSRLHLCFWQITWFCWLHHSMTFSKHSCGLQQMWSGWDDSQHLKVWGHGSLPENGGLLPQAKEFKYLGILFTGDGNMEHENDRRFRAASAVIRALYQTECNRVNEVSLIHV